MSVICLLNPREREVLRKPINTEGEAGDLLRTIQTRLKPAGRGDEEVTVSDTEYALIVRWASNWRLPGPVYEAAKALVSAANRSPMY